MTADILTIALLAGLATWAFRYLPTRLDPSAGHADGILARFLAATGPAAICTLFVAAILPGLESLPTDAGALAAGLVAVCAAFALWRSVAAATFAGAAAHALAFWVMASASGP